MSKLSIALFAVGLLAFASAFYVAHRDVVVRHNVEGRLLSDPTPNNLIDPAPDLPANVSAAVAADSAGDGGAIGFGLLGGLCFLASSIAYGVEQRAFACVSSET